MPTNFMPANELRDKYAKVRAQKLNTLSKVIKRIRAYGATGQIEVTITLPLRGKKTEEFAVKLRELGYKVHVSKDVVGQITVNWE